MARIANSRCVLAVRDLEVSTRYYVDVLGFRKDPINAEGWSFLTRDSFRVMLGECVDERPAGDLGNHSYFAYWNVEGVDDLYRELVAKGAIVSSPPTNKPWGLREFGLRTPDGHRIVLVRRSEPTLKTIPVEFKRLFTTVGNVILGNYRGCYVSALSFSTMSACTTPLGV